MHCLILLDTQDKDLGDFWTHCKKALQSLLASFPNIKLVLIDEDDSRNSIDQAIAQLEQQSFIFVGYMHGVDDKLFIQNDICIDVQNAYLFGSSFFYTFSCKAGTELAPALIQHGCKAFIGYSDVATYISSIEDDFIRCVNKGLESFLNGKTILECFYDIAEAYDEQMDKYINDLPIYAQLRRNRDSLFFAGDYKLTINDL